MAEVKWKIPRNADAERCWEEIQTIGEKVTPEQIVDYARNDTSELHKLFEWDDTVAAEKYRIIQAQGIVRNLVYVPAKKDDPPVRVLQITTETHEYQPTRFFLKQEDQYTALLKRALAELNAFKRKYKSLTELDKIFSDIDEILDKTA